jgi:hypothetical protein
MARLCRTLSETCPAEAVGSRPSGVWSMKPSSASFFARALKEGVTPQADLGALVDQLLTKSALGSLALARKAGAVVSGSTKVDQAIRSGAAALVLHAQEAASDGVRKLDQARRVVVHMDGPEIPAFSLFKGEEMDLAFGGGNVIHAAVLDGKASVGVVQRVLLLHRYRGESH